MLFRGDVSAAGDSYLGCPASSHRGQYYGHCQYEHAVRYTSGSRDREGGDAGPRFFDLPRDSAKDLSPPFSLDRVQVGHSQEVLGEDSLFSISPLSPGIFFQPPRGSISPPAGEALLPSPADDCVASGLGDPNIAAWCEQYTGSESPWSLPGCAAVWVRLSAGPSGASDWVSFEDLCPAAGGIIDLCTSRGPGGGRMITDWTAELSVQILGVRRSAVYRWKPGIWMAASSPSVSGIRRMSGVVPAPVSSCCSCLDCECCSWGNSFPRSDCVIQILPLHNQPDGHSHDGGC